MADSAMSSELREFIEALAGVFVQQLFSDLQRNKKTPGTVSDGPGCSGVRKERLGNVADDSTTVSIVSLPEGKTGDQNHGERISATSPPDARVGGVAHAAGQTGEDLCK
jgi:hypothetical protein